MSSYPLKCERDRKRKNMRAWEASDVRTMLFSNCSILDGKKLKFIREQKPNGWLH